MYDHKYVFIYVYKQILTYMDVVSTPDYSNLVLLDELNFSFLVSKMSRPVNYGTSRSTHLKMARLGKSGVRLIFFFLSLEYFQIYNLLMYRYMFLPPYNAQEIFLCS